MPAIRIREAYQRIRERLRTLPMRGVSFGLLIAAALGLGMWTILRPPLAAPEKDIAQAWNESIAKLGILALYPPQEDFHVGDVWAMAIRNANDETPFASRAVRVGTIDLLDAIRGGLGPHPAFDDTPVAADGVGYRTLPRHVSLVAPDGAQIPVTMAAFPGLAINRTIASGAGIDAGGWNGGADGRASLVERITIPAAATYGAPLVEVYTGYLTWCADPRYRALCTDAAVRQIMSYSHPDVLRVEEGKYLYRLQLLVISRVYLMREINHELTVTDFRGITAAFGHDRADAASPAPASTGEPATPAPDGQDGSAADPTAAAARPENSMTANPRTRAGALLHADGSLSSAISMPNQVFQRPLVFGYRAMAFALEPSQPKGRRE